MSSASTLGRVDDALDHLASLPPVIRKDRVDQFIMGCGLNIGLRNLKALLLLVLYCGEGDVYGYMASLRMTLQVSFSEQGRLFSRIQDAARKICREMEFECDSFPDSIYEIQCLAKQLDEWCTTSGQFPSKFLLTANAAVGIADTILANTVDFLRLANLEIALSPQVYKHLDALEVEITFLKSFLRIGVKDKQLCDLLAHVHPFIMNAAHIFIKDDPNRVDTRITSIDLEANISKLGLRAFDAHHYEAYSQVLCTLRCYPPAVDMLGIFLESLVSLIWSKLCLDSYRFYSTEDYLKVALYGRLRLCRVILKHSSKDMNEEIKNKIGVLICNAGILLISRYPANDGMSDVIQRFDAILAVAEVRTNAIEYDFPRANDPINEPNIVGGSWNEKEIQVPKGIGMPYRRHLSPAQVVAFQEDETTSVLNGLVRGSKHLRIVAIVGMAGLGKTTLALNLFNDPSVMRHFHVRAWFSVSQSLDKRRVFLQLLNQLQPGDYSEMSVDDLANKLRQSLKGKRYLIFLDDVWSSEAWVGLETSFPDDSTQSRIILTSRQYSIAHAGSLVNGEPYSLRLRKNEECLQILEAKLFPEMGWPLQLKDIGMEIAEKCKGLPLTTVIIAGLLAKMKQKSWKGILNDLSKGSLSASEQCKNTVALSYNHLPYELKACLLYFGAFPEDDVVSVKKLIRLWMAENFVRADEDVAREFLNQLIERSLVMVAQNRSIGGVKTCRVHDLLHDFFRAKVKQERFIDLLQGHDQLSSFSYSYFQQRLCIHSEPLYFKKSRLLCPRAHSLLFFSTQKRFEWYDYCFFDMAYIIKMSRLLIVVAIEQLPLTFELPSEIQLLSGLKYFSFQSNKAVIPPSMGKLSELETLIADFRSVNEEISFPKTLWGLKKLKYLHIRCFGGFILPNENSSTLSELETLRGVVFYSDGSMKEQMKNFPNIRRLKCRLKRTFQTPGEYDTEIVVPGFLRQLQSLTICGSGKLKCEFSSATNLTKVKLEGFLLSRKEIEAIGNIPNLKVLKLLEISFSGDTLEMEEGEFLELEFLEIVGSYGLKGWTATDEQLPCLQKLVMELCFKLKDIPSCLEAIPTLEEIQVYHCSPTLKTLVEHIEEQHKEYGNSIKVIVHEYDPGQAR